MCVAECPFIRVVERLPARFGRSLDRLSDHFAARCRLGMRLDEQLAELEGGKLTPDIVRRWAATERARAARQWAPLRQLPADVEEGGHEEARLVKFWDVEEGLFSVGARLPGRRLRSLKDSHYSYNLHRPVLGA